jgi:F0F1-type ATP synthase assembly protein I
MTGVVVHMIIGLILFTPIGFIAGFLQHEKEKKIEKDNSQPPERLS